MNNLEISQTSNDAVQQTQNNLDENFESMNESSANNTNNNFEISQSDEIYIETNENAVVDFQVNQNRKIAGKKIYFELLSRFCYIFITFYNLVFSYEKKIQRKTFREKDSKEKN